MLYFKSDHANYLTLSHKERYIPMSDNKKLLKRVWGGALLLAGIGVFFRIPQVMPQIEEIRQFSAIMPFIRFCFYLIGILLIGGGCRKLYETCQDEQDRNIDG